MLFCSRMYVHVLECVLELMFRGILAEWVGGKRSIVPVIHGDKSWILNEHKVKSRGGQGLQERVCERGVSRGAWVNTILGYYKWLTRSSHTPHVHVHVCVCVFVCAQQRVSDYYLTQK